MKAMHVPIWKKYIAILHRIKLTGEKDNYEKTLH